MIDREAVSMSIRLRARDLNVSRIAGAIEAWMADQWAATPGRIIPTTTPTGTWLEFLDIHMTATGEIYLPAVLAFVSRKMIKDIDDTLGDEVVLISLYDATIPPKTETVGAITTTLVQRPLGRLAIVGHEKGAFARSYVDLSERTPWDKKPG